MKSKNVNISYSEKSLTNPVYTEILFSDIVSQIQSPSEKVTKIIDILRSKRQDLSKKEKNNLKKLLPYFSMAKFKGNHRKNENFVETEFMILDFDKVKSVASLKTKIIKDKRTFCCFISPSGNGLKVIFKFSEKITDVGEYKKIYKYFANQFSKKFGYSSDDTSDAARACSISYDPDVYVNYDCEYLDVQKAKNEISTLEANKTSGNSDGIPFDETKLLNGVRVGQRNTSLTKLTGLYIQKKFNKKFTISVLLDWNQKNNPPLDEDEVIGCINGLYDRYEQSDGIPFLSWEGRKIKIDFNAFKQYLEDHGFRKYVVDEIAIPVRVEKNRVSEVKVHYIKEFLIDKISRPDFRNFLIEREKTLFSQGKYDFLKRQPVIQECDTSEEAYTFFRNGYVITTKDSIGELQDYSKLRHTIWRNQIINRDFLKVNESEIEESDIFKFIQSVCKSDTSRIKSFISAIGYILHDYDDPNEKKAVIFYDEKIPSHSDEANGGTGKSLLCQAIMKFKNNAILIDGQNIKFNTQFSFQEIKVDTKIVIFNDAKKHFPFHKLFSAITEGYSVERKRMDPFKVKNTKTIISTNMTIQGDGNSYRRREFELEFSDYFNEDHTPRDELGHLMFDDWGEKEWNLFDNFMIYCLQFYLEHGLIEYEKVNLQLRKLIDATSLEFVKYFQSLESLSGKHSKENLYCEFLKFSDHNEKEYSKHKFTKQLHQLLDYLGLSKKPYPGAANLSHSYDFGNDSERNKRLLGRNNLDEEYQMKQKVSGLKKKSN